MRSTLLVALACGTAAIATPALGQTTDDQATTGSGAFDPSQTIIVTGSRVSDRTVADSPVPVDVIGGEQLQNSGYSETNKVLNQLVPSFNFPQPSLTDGTDSMRPATLRGLAPDQTLVLINGKRRHTSALLNLNGSVGRGSSSVDLNEIPPIAIDRIEVLRDGASSLYGSDAIAGVINIELSKRVGVRGTVTYGQYRTRMDGVDAVTGVVTGPGGLPVVTSAGSSPSGDFLELQTTGKDRVRHDGETVTLATSIGLPVENGYFVFSGQFSDRDPTNRSGADPRRQFNNVGDPRELTFDRYNHRFGDGKSTDYNFFVNAGHDIGTLELYAFGSYGIRDANAAGFYRRSNDSRNRDYGASLTDFVPYYPNGFLPAITSEIEDVSGAVGLKGEIGGGWNADLSVVYGSNQLDYGVVNSFNTSIGSPDSPERFDAGGMATGQTVANLDLTHPLNVDFMKSLGVAVGGEYRNENFKIRPGQEASYINGPYSAYGAPGGSQVFPGFRPNNAVDASRDSFAGYVEVDGDVSDALSFQLAGRYEHYSDFGDTLNGKVAARFEIVPGVALRGSASTGFRAPSLAQQFFATTSTNNVAGTLIEVGTFPVSNPVSVALGSKPLKAEKSTNLGGGIALNPIAGLSLTADYYNIKVRDRVTLTENLQGADVVTILQNAGINNVTSARFFVNGVDTRTQGIDIVGTYHLPDTGFGSVTLTAGYNYNKTKITDRASLPSLPGLILFGRTESLRLTHGQPRDKINLSADWSLDRFGITARTNRYGKVLSPGGSNDLAVGPGDGPADYTLGAKWITDIEGRVTLVDGLQVAVGADNVFDVYPDHVPVGGAFGTAGYYLPYSSFSPFGFNGRFLYGRLSINY
ncbi:iron complex outermembrane receptor protein [Hephaestia caeni]|uniref:Iron complex outermembrane receptor protein n=1 Tax=Hephaestia caeni TaxID=645617 RepID=A0A397PI20_9SPHN|nr:TonB-dependent receptor [Hephaestia caeni]RIA46797.1 iron complex outermembrane receptor protein [Hephaestia caeni]